MDWQNSNNSFKVSANSSKGKENAGYMPKLNDARHSNTYRVLFLPFPWCCSSSSLFFLAQCPRMPICFERVLFKKRVKIAISRMQMAFRAKVFFVCIRMKSVFLTPTVNPIESLLNVIDMMKKRTRTLNASMDSVWLAAVAVIVDVVVVVIVVLKFGCMFPAIIKLRIALIKRNKLWISLLYTEHMVRAQFSSCCKAISSIFYFSSSCFFGLKKRRVRWRRKKHHICFAC